MPVIRFVRWIAEKITEAAEREYYDPEVIRGELINFSERLEAGEITKEDYDEKEAELMDRLAQSQEREVA